MPNQKHILVIRLSAMGDVAMTVPILRIFREQYPDVKLTIVTRAHFAPMFSGIEGATVYAPDLKGKHKGVLGLWKLSRELKKLQFNAVADLHNVLRSKILKFFFTGIQVVQIDKGREEKKGLVNGNLKPLKSTHQRYAEVFEKLGYKLDLSEPNLRIKLSIPESVEHSLETTKPKTEKWIGIAPFAAYESKMYPLDQMKEVIATLSKQYKVFLFGGGEKEVSILNAIADTNDNVVNLAGKLNLDNELSVISNLDVMLSMDSGNGHLAALFGVKVVTIWGVTHPYAGFTPFNQPETHQLLADRDQFPLIPTSVYGNTYPEGYQNAAGSIPVVEIVDKIKSVIPV